MPEKQKKTKDMVIAVFLTILTILCIVFYFLPAFNVKHKYSPADDFETVTFSAWDLTRATFSSTAVIESKLEKLIAIKGTYGFAVILSGLLMPLSLICIIATTVFAYLSWLKSDGFKKYCFLFSLVGMVFGTMTLITTWFIAIKIRSGNNFDVFGANLKGAISYGAFVSLILAFVVAIVACAYNYFLDDSNDSDEDDEDEEDDDEEDDEEEIERLEKMLAEKKKKKSLENKDK